MFILSPSYGSNWRVFCSENRKENDIFKRMCIWGGADKTEEIDGVTYKGYEFGSLVSACQSIQIATYGSQG